VFARPVGPRVLFAVAAILATAGPTNILAQGSRRPTRILLLYQQQAEAPTMVEFTRRLRLTVSGALRTPVEFYQESLDFDRFDETERYSPLTSYLGDKYRGVPVDLVVPVGGRALRFTVDHLRSVFPGVPVVFALNAAPQTNPATLPSDVTGRLAGASRFAPTLAMARALQPDADRVVIIGGSSASDSATVASAVEAVRDALPVMVLQGLSLEALLKELHHLPKRSIVLLANFRRDGLGQVFDPVDLVGTMARASAAPMYTQLRSYIGEGPVGGSLMGFDEEGARTGQLIAHVLRRRANEPMPPAELIGNSFAVDARQLRRWNLDEARLPPGTEILFREPSLWEQYRTTALIGLGVISVEALLIGLLLLERQRRRRAQLALEAQAAYEQTIAGLTTDAARHAADAAPRALEDALARIGRYAGASNAILEQWPDNSIDEPLRLSWHASENGHGGAGAVSKLELPLIADGTSMGRLELQRNDGRGWAATLIRRLDSAGEIMAGAMARSRAMRRVEETRRQVAHMARMAFVGELAATISHELRQPLAAIRVNAEAGVHLLAGTPSDVSEAREVFRNIVADDVRAVELIEGVRKLLRKEESTTTTVDLNEICRDAVRLLQHDAVLRGTRLELVLADEPPLVTGDPIQLQQVVLNLALNGLESASASASDRCVTIRTETGRDHAEVLVRDSGAGIPSHVQPHLFESFFSTKTDGLGLGLVIVRSIVERHNGRIKVENVATGGAIFRVQLPVRVRPLANTSSTAVSETGQ
jgi:signal transduction histidine kinase